MQTFILTWSPNYASSFPEYADFVERIDRGETPEIDWAASRAHISPGDRLFMLRQRQDRGLIGSGYATNEPRAGEHWDGQETSRPVRYVKMRFDAMLDVANVLPIETLIEAVPGVAWNNIYESGRLVPADSANALELLWQGHLAVVGSLMLRLPEELPGAARFIEGAVTQIIVNAYERNRLARQRCVEHHGYKCAACDISLEDIYGSLGHNYIHVHHLRSLAEIGQEYEVDPIQDLRPVCPNCHAMLHRRPGRLIGIEELREIIAAERLQVRATPAGA